MTSSKKDPVLVVLQLSGAYDALNTVIPYSWFICLVSNMY